MQMIPVRSSNLVAVGYNPTTLELTVQFRKGVYTYSGVRQNVYNGLISSPSKGKFHHRFIKQYPCRPGF